MSVTTGVQAEARDTQNQSRLTADVAHQVIGASGAVCNGPCIAREPAVLGLRVALTGCICGAVQCDHVVNITMAVDKGTASALV